MTAVRNRAIALIVGLVLALTLALTTVTPARAGVVTVKAVALLDHAGPFVQVSNQVPGRNVKIANHSNETETPNPFYEFVNPGHFSSRGALAFYVRAGEQVGYRSLATGVDYISRCGSVGGSWEPIGNSVLLTNYLVRRC